MLAGPLVLAGCTAAAETPEKPALVDCLVIFGLGANARAAADVRAAMQLRAMYLAEQQGGTRWLKDAAPAAIARARALEAEADEGRVVALLKACIAHQDADDWFASFALKATASAEDR